MEGSTEPEEKEIERGTDTGGAGQREEQSSSIVHETPATDARAGLAEQDYPSKPTLVILTIAMILVVTMSGFDTNIIGIAIPQITTEFNSINDIGWYGSAYLVALMALQTIYGSLYKLFTLKWIYIATLVIFEAGSVVCASAPSSAVFIFGRALAGAGAAGMFSGTLALGGDLVPLRRRPFYISLVAGVNGVASGIAPVIGGLFTSSRALGWRFCFWINLPIGGIAAITIILKYKSKPSSLASLSWKTKFERLDVMGTLLLIASMVSLMLSLQWGGNVYPWTHSKVWGCLLGFALLLCVFIVIQIRQKDSATVPLRILFHRSVGIGCLYICCLRMGHYIFLYYLPLYFQIVQNVTALESGVRVLPYILSTFLAATLVGVAMTKTGIYVPFMWASAAVYAAGCGLLYTLDTNSRIGHWFGYQLLAGCGFGIGFQIPYTVVQACLKSAEDILVGNALVLFFQTLGGAVALGVAQNVFSRALRRRLTALGLEKAVGTLTAVGATQIATEVPPEMRKPVHEAFSVAVTQTFIISIASAGAGLIFSLGMEWRRVEEKEN